MTIMMDLLEAAKAMAGRLEGSNLGFSGVSTDSRTITEGELFVALRGGNFDGHQFIENARKNGAVAAVIDTRAFLETGDHHIPYVVVDDTRLALGQLACYWRSRFVLPLLAVTGSNGKTTTKEMLSSIFHLVYKEKVLATQGNLNNDIGMPMTLLKLNADHQAAIIEMGMNRPGEINYLTGIAKPTVALVTNVQRAHLAGMGTLEAIAIEKGQIFEGLGKSGIAVFCADEPWALMWKEQNRERTVWDFSFERDAKVTGRYQRCGFDNYLEIGVGSEQKTVHLFVPGQHNAYNALAAATMALATGISLEHIGAGLENFTGVARRLQKREGKHNALLIDDTYNANPDSVRAAIDVLAATLGKKILVLGDMREVGDKCAQLHDEISGYAKSQGIDRLYALGEASMQAVRNFDTGGRHFKKAGDLITAVISELTPETTILVKGSRSMRMERIADAIALHPGERSDHAA